VRIDLTEDERNAICNAAYLAIEDQKNYLSTGSPDVDYGGEWPRVAGEKAESFLCLSSALQKLKFFEDAADAAELAGRLLEVSK